MVALARRSWLGFPSTFPGLFCPFSSPLSLLWICLGPAWTAWTACVPERAQSAPLPGAPIRQWPAAGCLCAPGCCMLHAACCMMASHLPTLASRVSLVRSRQSGIHCCISALASGKSRATACLRPDRAAIAAHAALATSVFVGICPSRLAPPLAPAAFQRAHSHPPGRPGGQKFPFHSHIPHYGQIREPGRSREML